MLVGCEMSLSDGKYVKCSNCLNLPNIQDAARAVQEFAMCDTKCDIAETLVRLLKATNFSLQPEQNDQIRRLV